MNREETYKEIEELRERILKKVQKAETCEHYELLSDIGGVRISSCDFSAVYSNGYGDGVTDVYICEDNEWELLAELFDGLRFISSFNVLRSGSVWLMSYDCDLDLKAAVTLKPGRYFVYRGSSHELERGLVVLARDVERVEIATGGTTNYDDAVERMDDDLREKVHAELMPCSHQRFFNRYCLLHLEKFGLDFAEMLDVETYDD
jgi:hypothetical protein